MSALHKQSFKQKYKDSAELCVYNCGWQKCERGYTWGPGVRDHYLLHYIASGNGTYEVNGTVYALTKGDVFFSKPDELIKYKAGTIEPWEYYWVGFNGPYANKVAYKLPFKNSMPVHKCADTKVIEKAFSNIFNSRGSQSYSEALMVGHLYILIAAFIKEAQLTEPQKAGTSSQYVDSAIKFIQHNYSGDIGIDDIAKSVGVSRSHLYRVFVNNIGKSPVDYLTGYRIGEACFLLKNSKLSIAEVAVSVGFYDQFYFSRVFKKAKGVPPSKYIAVEDNDVNVTQTE